MTATVNDVLYMRIGQTATAMVGTGTNPQPNAVSSSYDKEVVIEPYVTIDSIKCTVTKISKFAFSAARNVPNIVIPNTITTFNISK